MLVMPMPMLGPEWGLYTQVAKKIGRSRTLVSLVDRGLKTSKRVTAALARERARRQKKGKS